MAITSIILVAFEKMNRAWCSIQRSKYKSRLTIKNKSLELLVFSMGSLEAFKAWFLRQSIGKWILSFWALCLGCSLIGRCSLNSKDVRVYQILFRVFQKRGISFLIFKWCFGEFLWLISGEVIEPHYNLLGTIECLGYS